MKNQAVKKKRGRFKVGTLELMVVAFVLIVFLVTITVPLRNYFEQRNEIRAVNAAIAQKQRHKEELLGELERYKSKAYLDEQARNRLGVIAPGEVAFRIVDPSMTKDDALTSTDHKTPEKVSPWYDTLWGSVAVPPQSAPDDSIEPTTELKLPIEPAEPPVPPQEPLP